MLPIKTITAKDALKDLYSYQVDILKALHPFSYPNLIPQKHVPVAKQIIFNDPATIICWEDGTKTVVKVMEGDTFDEHYGVAMAFMKKMFGTSHFKKMIKKLSKEK